MKDLEVERNQKHVYENIHRGERLFSTSHHDVGAGVYSRMCNGRCCQRAGRPARPLVGGTHPRGHPPLFHETFDEVYSRGMTNAQVTLGNYTYVESWSGYALQRVGTTVMPFVVSALDSGCTNFAGAAGTLRCWFKPTTWSSVTSADGTGPGATATLLEVDAIGKNDSANAWAILINPEGTLLSLVAQSDSHPTLLLQTEISWAANQSHLIALEYNSMETVLYLDGQIVAQGAGVPTVPTDLAALIVGSSLTGRAVAGGDFDELFCFGVPPTRPGRPARKVDISFYWNYTAPYAALGPINADEIAAREKRLAENKSNRTSAQRSSSQMSSMSAERNTCGPLDASACVTNGAVFMTNVWAELETNGTMTVTFDLVGGTNATGLFYDIFTTTNLADGNATALQWTWLARGPTCHTYQFTNQPLAAAFYLVGTPQDTDGDGMSDAFERLVSRTDPLVGENRIQTENAITGTTNWMLFNPITSTNAHGWPLNDEDTLPEIQGFAAATSVNVGDTIDLYVDVRATNNPAAANYTVEIFRLGWYGGQGGRQMTWNDGGARTNVTLTSHIQPVPKMNPTNGLIDCLSGWTTNGVTNSLIWQRSYTLAVPTNWVSGVYVARLTTGTNVTPQTTGRQSYIIFTVREDARTSDLLCQASVTTWQAYNPWGGSSTYPYPNSIDCYLNYSPNSLNLEGGTVSFNRPYAPTTCPVVFFSLGYGSGAGEFLTMINFGATPAWEYNMVRWLERQGYDVTYTTSVDTHRACPANKGIKTFVSVGHDEYWSAPMRVNVEAARDRGVNLTFFAANVCYWQIHFQDNERVFSVDKRYTSGTYYDRWRGAATVNNPEISLVGEEFFFINGSSGETSDIRMPATLPSGSGIGGYHWAYDYSGLTNGQVLPLLLGPEADGCFDTNLCNCTATPLEGAACPGSNTVRLADSPIFCSPSLSCNPTNGPGVTNGHSYVTLYSACNGAQVFAAGSIQWSWGLDDYATELIQPTFASRVQPAARQMTHNVLRTFSGRPTAPVIFANGDTITSGNWTNGYAANYVIADTATITNLPSYAQVTLTNQQVQVWTSLATDSRALLKPPYYTNRIAAAWTTTNTQGFSFTIDINLTDTNTHPVALYCVDWLGTGTVIQKLEVYDYTNNSVSLDTRNFQLPTNGVYLIWNLSGHKIIRVSKQDASSGNKAMVSGLFIGERP